MARDSNLFIDEGFVTTFKTNDKYVGGGCEKVDIFDRLFYV